MDYTLASLTDRVKDRLQDLEFNDVFIKDSLNEAYFNVVGEDSYPFFEKVDDVYNFMGSELDLPRDYQKTLEVVAKDKLVAQHLAYIPYKQFFVHKNGSHSPLLLPFAYTCFGGKIYYHLPKDKRRWHIRHLYLAKPVAMEESDDTTLIPYEYSEILVLGALVRCEQKRDNFDMAGVYEQQRQQLVENMKLRYLTRTSDDHIARLTYRRR